MNGKLAASGVGAQQQQQQDAGPRTNGTAAAAKLASGQGGPNLEMKLTNEKRVRESSEVSSSSGCESEESRAADDDMYGNGQSKEAGSKEQEERCKEGTPDSERTKDGDQTDQCVNAEGGRPKLPRPSGTIACPRCDSEETKFCYYNNYNIKQPRYFCKSCQRYWTSGGTLRNVPVGAGRRKHKSSSKSDKNKSDSMNPPGHPQSMATVGQFSPFNKGSNSADAMALTYAAVAAGALKPQPMVISYPPNQNQPTMVPTGPEAASGLSEQNQKHGNAHGQGHHLNPMVVVQDSKQRSRSSRSKKKKQFILADHLDSKSLSSSGVHNLAAAGQMNCNDQQQNQARALQAMLQLNSAQHQAAYQQAANNANNSAVNGNANNGHGAPDFANQQAYQQLLSQNWVQLWQQMYLQSGWSNPNLNPAAAQPVFGIKREGGWPMSAQPRQGSNGANGNGAGARQNTPQTATPQQPQPQPQNASAENNKQNGNANSGDVADNTANREGGGEQQHPPSVSPANANAIGHSAPPAVVSAGRDGQIPWWYTQMINNFAASQNPARIQNPAAMQRSFNLQAQVQVQETNQEDNQT